MNNKSILGGMLLVTGTTIGAGMLALPASISQNGFYGATLMLLLCWVSTTFSALLLLEANLRLPINSNIISMAKKTLGPLGAIVAWLSYLLLLYSLLSAYIAGGSDVLGGLLVAGNIPSLHWLDELLFAGILGIIVYRGIKTVDYVNRGLMSTKFIAIVLLIISLIPFIHVSHLTGISAVHLPMAVTVVVTSFGYAVIIPSIRTYYNSDVAKLRKIIIVGSFIPLLGYFLWVSVVLAVLPMIGHLSLVQIFQSADPNTQLTQALSFYSRSEWITVVTRVFTSVCMATSFLGVSLCLSDFLADGMNVKKHGRGAFLIYVMTFVPPLLIVLFYPAIFIKSLSYAGIFCAILLIILPVLMVWSGRRKVEKGADYQVRGGKPAMVIVLLAAVVIIVFGLYENFF